jgi:hypothetical protein
LGSGSGTSASARGFGLANRSPILKSSTAFIYPILMDWNGRCRCSGSLRIS